MESLALEMTSGDLKALPKFVGELPSRYTCVKCKDVLRGPIQTPCGHRFCNPCFREILTESNETGPVRCYGGEEDCVDITLSAGYPDICAAKEIHLLPVHCGYEKYGCPEKVPWKDLDKHALGCTFAAVQCSNNGCDVVLPPAEITRHQKEDCPYTPVACRQCEEMVLRKSREQHLREECLAMSVPCPYKCGEQAIVRSDLPEHVRRCRSKPMECKFRSRGCKFTGSKPEVEHHHKSGTAYHLELVTVLAASMQVDIAKLHNDIEEASDSGEQLKNQMVRTQDEMAGHAKTLDQQRRKVSKMEESLHKKEKSITELRSEVRALRSKCEQNEAGQNKQLHGLQETLGRHDRRLGDLERMGLVENQGFGGSGLGQDITRQDRQLALYDVRLAEMDLRFQCLETASYDGVLIWKITDYSRRKQEAFTGRTLSLYSQPFYTHRHGYKMCARVYLNGDGLGKNTHMSLFFVVMRGDYDTLLQWPFRQRVTLSLLDQHGGKRNLSDDFRPDPGSSSFQRPEREMNVASGCPLFVAQSRVEAPPYLVTDAIFIKVVVDVT